MFHPQAQLSALTSSRAAASGGGGGVLSLAASNEPNINIHKGSKLNMMGARLREGGRGVNEDQDSSGHNGSFSSQGFNGQMASSDQQQLLELKNENRSGSFEFISGLEIVRLLYSGFCRTYKLQ